VSGEVPAVSLEAEPLIFTGMETIGNRCGHGDVVAVDGHELLGTPRIMSDDSNFLELLPEGARVDIIDCRLWTDQEDLNWLAVRTTERKLGWMLVQPDKFYITLHPIPLELPPLAITGVPAAGELVAYVPPSACETGPVTDEAKTTSVGVDLVPVVGDIKGVHDAVTGCDMVTGEQLGSWRWFGLFGLIGLSEIALMRHGDDVVDGIRVVDNLAGSLRYSDDQVIIAVRNVDTAAELANELRRLERGVEGSSDVAHSLDNAQALSDDAVRALADLPQPCSFDADTLVSTSRGAVPISSINPGDLVLAFNEATQTTGYYTTTAAFSHIDETILTLTIGQDVLVTTPEHPFFVEERWIAAGDLEIGDVVTSASGVFGNVQHIEVSHQPQRMYNLTVAQAHTYYVGTDEWLVHNACRKTLRNNLIGSRQLPAWTADTDWQAHHIIPVQLENHPFLNDIDRNWIDSAQNGIALPNLDADARRLDLPAHRGSHRHYTEYVQDQLNQLNDDALAENWSANRKFRELQNLVSELREYIRQQSSVKLS
jgi:hypothetical protein